LYNVWLKYPKKSNLTEDGNPLRLEKLNEPCVRSKAITIIILGHTS
jgi:hypothetical protein